jgi:acetyltransferase-like isoleucine patch superfamily enzyme
MDAKTWGIIRAVIYLPSRLLNSIKLRINNVNCDNHIDIRGSLLLLNEGKCNLGRNIIINSSRFKNIIGGDTRTSIIIKKNASLTIGDGTRISNSAIYCAEKIEIGKNVMIGGSVKIWDTDFHPLDPMIRMESPNEKFLTKPVQIRDNVFIGGFTIILKGVTIGENAIVGAGSVVSRNIPPHEIWAGNPVQFIKKIENLNHAKN